MTKPTHSTEETPAQAGPDCPTAPPTPSPNPSALTANFLPPVPSEPTELMGSFGRYLIVRRLGKGGMGRVYLARDTQLDRNVAVKVPHLDGGDRATVRERFYREARAAATLHHPNICPVHDVGSIGDVPYLTMTYIEGQTLFEWSASLRPVAEVVSIVRKVALALEEAHAHGIIHRDLKPSNIMIDRRGEPVVMDFGLARRLHLPDEARLTSPGLLMGTPAYLPPEHVQADVEPAPSTDVYSLGVILYELLTGRCPFSGSVMSVLAQVVTDVPLPPSHLRLEVPPRLDAICLQAIAKNPAARFRRMADLAEALDDVGSAKGPPPVPGRETAPSAPAVSPDARFAPRILELLRTWGWARAVQKMRNRAQHADTPAQRIAYQGFLDWMAGERTSDADAAEAFQALPCGKALRGWALVGQASHLLRDRDYPGAQKLLDRAFTQGDPDDRMLQATIAHTRGAAHVHRGQSDPALPFLHQALDLFGREHFMTGRVLDTLGMAYAYRGNFPVAREFYQQSIRYKQNFDDEAGIAISHGQLGRLYLDWDHLDEADEHFHEDLRLAQKIRSRWSEAQIYNHLGQVALARGEREARAGRRAAARRQFASAAGWLEQSIRSSEEGKFGVSEGFARKDRALVYLHEGDLDRAEEQVRLALERFASNQFAEGTAKAHLVEGMILRQRERWHESERKFRSALGHFEETQEADKAVRALWEIARTLRDGGAAAPLVTRAYLEALARAETSRHDPLVRGIEEELHEIDVEAYLRHVYRRARGAGIDDDSASLVEGTDDVATVLAIDLPGFTEFARGLDSETVLLTFNHLLADFADVLAPYQARVLSHRGNGLVALTRDSRHAERAVRAALDLVAAMEEFNRPRQLLGLPIFHVRIGISSGDVLLGNVGTYLKMDFTAIGATVNLAGALRNEAEPGVPCISRATHEQVRDRFGYRSTSPRAVQASGFGLIEVWDVAQESNTRGRT